MAKKSRITRIRTLYAILIGVAAAFIALFIMNVVSAADPIEVGNIGTQSKNYGLFITDLQSRTGQEPIVVTGLNDSLSATVHISRYTMAIASDNEELITSSKAYWCFGLQLFSVLAFVAMVILTVIALISFYINVRNGKVFPKKKIRWLTWIGMLMIAMSLCMDISTWIEQSLAASLLAGSDWEPSTAIQLHTTRLFYGLTIIFMAQIFYIGREMQEEQELTI